MTPPDDTNTLPSYNTMLSHRFMPMRFLLFAFPLLLCSLHTRAQTFYGVGGTIPNNGNPIAYNITVSGLPNVMDTLNFGLQSVCVNITHTWVGELAVSLVAPDGTVLPLFYNIGGDANGFVNTCLNSNATNSIFQQVYPFTGTFRPFGDMGTLNNKSLNPNGVWKLLLLDTEASNNAGNLGLWKITFGNQPCKQFPFQSSDLPIVKINTAGQFIPNEPKINAAIQVIDNGAGERNLLNQTNFAFEGNIGIEVRGVSSQGFPKKSFAIEVRDTSGNDLDVSLLGLPQNSDFALQANYSDKTLMRNALAYEVFRQLDHYATRTRFCELVLNNTYQGIYILTELIKRGKDRVDIAKLSPEDTTGTNLTGGYIVHLDRNTSPGWNSRYTQPNSPSVYTYFQLEYPNWVEMHPRQRNYIKSYVDSFEVALHGANFQHPTLGWRRFGDEKSFIDYLILNEISKNVDGYRLSTYFHKNRDDKGGKLTMGAPWDYDLAWYNADYCQNYLVSGWAYNLNYICGNAGIPFWWERLTSDTLFAENLACRWHDLRNNGNTLNTNHVSGLIDSMATVLNEAKDRNFKLWPILGQYVWPNPGPLPTTYAGEINKMKNWLTARLQWLDMAISQHLPLLQAQFTANPLTGNTWQFYAPPGYLYAWDFGDGGTSNLAAPQHLYAENGSYTVKLSISTPYGCQDNTEQIILADQTATQAPESGQFHVWPNPTNTFLNVTRPDQLTEKATLRLIGTLGQTLLEETFEAAEKQHRMHLNGLPKGVYCLEIRTATSRKTSRVLVN